MSDIQVNHFVDPETPPKQCCDKCICEAIHSSTPPVKFSELE